MDSENRKNERFDNMGRVECSALCPLPGVLDDISMDGCRVHFPVPFEVDMENDYELKVKLTVMGTVNMLVLIAHPQWVTQEDSETSLGFKLLRSPNTPELQRIIGDLSKKAEFDDDIAGQIIDSQVHFV